MRFAAGLATIGTILFAVVFALFILCGAAHAQNREKYAWAFPLVEDPELSSFLADPAVFWYTAAVEMPPVFQHDFEGSPRFYSIYRDIGPSVNRFSNGNGEWPWAHPATPTNDGLTKNIIGIKHTGVQTFRAQFPQFEIHRTFTQGQWFAKVVQKGVSGGLGWSFGSGTDIVELNLNRIVRGDYTFKVHRMTLSPENEWVFRVYRPLTSAEEYQAATGTKPVYIGKKRMTTNHMVKPFDEVRDIWEVPRIDPALAREILLTKKFKLATDDAFIPTTRFRDQIYPQNYLGAYIGNAESQENCRKCHQDVATNVRKFDPGEWYGQFRGGAKDKHGVGVFSWYPK